MLLALLLVALVASGTWFAIRVLTEPGTTTVPIYACVQGPQVVWWGSDRPEGCPAGSELIYDPDVLVIDQNESVGHRLTVVLRSWLSIPGVMATLAVASCGWILLGYRLHGALSTDWLLVPLLLLIAATFVAGPGHWFPKEPYEGPSVISLGTHDAVTALDLAGFALAGLALVLAFHLTTNRPRSHPTHDI